MLRHLKWRIPDNFLQYSHFLEELGEVDLTSSPGYPYCISFTNNQQFLKAVDGVVDPLRSADLYEEVVDYMEERSEPNPIRLFVKPEPNSRKKHENGAYRLISSVSIKERMVDSMLFGNMNRKVKETWPISPIRIGWVPQKGGYKIMHYLPQQAADRSSWDWTVEAWLLELALEIRTALCENMDPRWEYLARKRYRDLFHSPWLVTSGGLHLQQLEPGVQKSGCFNTTVDNSLMQLIMHSFACLRLNLDPGVIIAVGDDTLQSPQPDEYFEFISRYCILKPVENVTEFCGYRFLPGGIVDPVHEGKHAFNILHMPVKVSREMALSYSIVYHRGYLGPWFKQLFAYLGLEVFDDRVLDALWDGEDGSEN